MNKESDFVSGQEAFALYQRWERLKVDSGLSGNQAARILGKSPAWFCLRRTGKASFEPKPRPPVARRLLTELPCWWIAAAKFFWLNSNLSRLRGSVPEAVKRTIALPQCPPAVVKRLAAILTTAGWQPENGERLPTCPPALREEILARVAARKPIVPDALARQVVVAPAFVRQNRNPRAAVLDYISAAGTQMWTDGESGEREFVTSGRIFEADDATANMPCVIPWEIRGCPCSGRWGVKVARWQWLVSLDVGSRKALGYAYTARPRSSYRGEDILSLMRAVVKQHGVPAAWRLERSAWESELVTGAVKNMGADRLTVHSPHAKPFIEGLFSSMWTKLSSHFPCSDVGRFRGENQEANRLLVACQSGAQDPRRHFPMLADVLAAFDQVIAEHNEHLIDSENYGRWVPNERWEADTAARPLPCLAPESEWLFSPFARTWTVKGNTVSGRVPLFDGVSIPYVFSAPWLLEYHGARVRAHFDPSEPRCCAKVVLAESTAGHREGEVLGDAWQINETTAYARLAMGWGQSAERREGLEQIRQASAALRRSDPESIRPGMPSGAEWRCPRPCS